ncbi:MAG: DNA-3-methyladenine glycosylase 2 family protein, partial [Caulobacteraceae bacterium]
MDHDACYRALATRDPRFDGRLFVAVKTTGIYCRPICPARTPKRENVLFFTSAAGAHAAGYRPCLRCRPETAPDLGAWRGTCNTVSRALALIEAGALDGAGVERLAGRLGVGGRQLSRLFRRHLGASPTAVAQTRRVLLAKQLIHQTRLPMGEIALASGFGSVRRFNETFQQLYRRPPASLRRAGGEATPLSPGDRLSLTLSYRAPYDWNALIGFLAMRAIAGVETVSAAGYARSIAVGAEVGVLEVAPTAGSRLTASIRFSRLGALPTIVARVRGV